MLLSLKINAVLAVSKVLNLKANHNNIANPITSPSAVLAVSKVLNLKANHNTIIFLSISIMLY